MRALALVPFALLLAAGCSSDTSPEAVCRQIHRSAQLAGYELADWPDCVPDMAAYRALTPEAYERYASCVIGTIEIEEINRCGTSKPPPAGEAGRGAAAFADGLAAAEVEAESESPPAAPSEPRAAPPSGTPPRDPRLTNDPLLALLDEHPEVDVPAMSQKLTRLGERGLAQTHLAVLYMAAQAHADEHGSFPTEPVDSAPGSPCCEADAACDEVEPWPEVPWVPAELAPADTPHFAYSYRPSGDGASFTVSAHGDLDCDGELSLLTVRGTRAEDDSDRRAIAAMTPVEDRAPLE